MLRVNRNITGRKYGINTLHVKKFLKGPKKFRSRWFVAKLICHGQWQYGDDELDVNGVRLNDKRIENWSKRRR